MFKSYIFLRLNVMVKSDYLKVNLMSLMFWEVISKKNLVNLIENLLVVHIVIYLFCLVNANNQLKINKWEFHLPPMC